MTRELQAWLSGRAILAQADTDEIESAVESAQQISGWQIFAAVVVLVAAWPIGRFVQRIVRRGFRKVPDVPTVIVGDVARGAKWLVYLTAFAAALALVGVDVGWVAVVTVVVLVVVVLAIRPMMQNTAAGLVLTARPAFGVGDQIEAMGVRGTVLSIGSHTTVLKSVDGVRSHIPNTSLIGQTIKVYTAFDTRRAQFDLSLAAGTDIATALGIVAKALAAADGVASDPAPEVLASRLDQDAMIVTARIWYSSSMTSDIEPVGAAILAVRTALDEAGIELGGATTALDIAHGSNDAEEP